MTGPSVAPEPEASAALVACGECGGNSDTCPVCRIPSAAPLAPSTAARAVALLHEDYHAGKVCFVTDPVECAGHQDAHDITQLLVNAGLLAWGEADRHADFCCHWKHDPYRNPPLTCCTCTQGASDA